MQLAVPIPILENCLYSVFRQFRICSQERSPIAGVVAAIGLGLTIWALIGVFRLGQSVLDAPLGYFGPLGLVGTVFSLLITAGSSMRLSLRGSFSGPFEGRSSVDLAFPRLAGNLHATTPPESCQQFFERAEKE